MKPILAVALLGFFAAPAVAQEHEHPKPDSARRGEMMGHKMPMMGMMQEMMGPMMRVMAYTPEHLLARKDTLALTPQQVTRLTVLRDSAKTAHEAAKDNVKTHHDALTQVMAASAPDTAALRQHFQAAHAAMGSLHWTMLRAAARAKAVLTDAQRGRVEGWADAMQMRTRRGAARRPN